MRSYPYSQKANIEILNAFKDSVDYEEYVEIKNKTVKYFTKKFGLQPKEK